MDMEKTLVIGASEKPDRYSNRAVELLKHKGKEVIALGNKKGTISGTEILTGFPELKDIHTVSLYLNPLNQKKYYDYITGLNPKRVIFNPGTENPEFYQKLQAKGIAFEEACTLVLLNTGSY